MTIDIPTEVVEEIRVTADDLPQKLAAAIGEILPGNNPDPIRRAAESVLATHARAIERLENLIKHASPRKR